MTPDPHVGQRNGGRMTRCQCGYAGTDHTADGLCACCGKPLHESEAIIAELRGQLAHARQMAYSPGRDPASVLRDVRGALGLDRNTTDPAGDAPNA